MYGGRRRMDAYPGRKNGDILVFWGTRKVSGHFLTTGTKVRGRNEPQAGAKRPSWLENDGLYSKTARCETTAGNSSVVAESHRRRLRIVVHMGRYL